VSTSISGKSARESRYGKMSTMPNTSSMLWREVGEEEACGAVEVEVEVTCGGDVGEHIKKKRKKKE
jgi:hypothetical protein